MKANLRKIDLTGFEAVSAQAQVKPEVCWIDIARLVIDDLYQRPLECRGRGNIQRIARDFSWGRFMPVLVAPVSERQLAIIDGQHRVHAAALCGFKQVPAMIVEMTNQEQARSFAWINGQVTAITPLQVFKAALVAGEDWATSCRQVVAEADCTMMTTNYSANKKKPGQVFCIGLIKSHVLKSRGTIVRRGLKAIRQSVGGDHVEYYGAVVLKAWFATIEITHVWSVPVLVEFLNARPFGEVLHKVDRLRETPEYFNKSRGVLFQASLGALLGQFLRDHQGAVS